MAHRHLLPPLSLTLLHLLLVLLLLGHVAPSRAITHQDDVAALRAFHRQVFRASGAGIPGWFPRGAPGADPCGDAYASPRVLPFPGVLCPAGEPGQKTPVRVLSLVLFNKGIKSNSLDPITGLRKLTALALQGNRLRGPLPRGLTALHSLQNLDLSSNQLSGTIPDLSPLPLATLVLSNQTGGNQKGLQGPIPPSLGTIASLSKIDLSGNSLSGPIPTSLLRLPLLDTLYLRSNKLSGPIPDLTPLASTLRNLDLSRNPFQAGPLPAWLNNLTLLNSVLDLSYTNRTGGLINLRYLGAVTDLILNGNALSGPLNPWRLPVGSLGYISVRNNRFNGTLSPGLFTALNNNLYCLETCGIDFGGNRFTGRLPPILGKLLQAFVFDFSFNRLTGGVPNSYGYIYSMLQLKLQGNQLTGPLPDFNPPKDITYQLMLVQLDLSHNALSGPLPPHLSRFTRLQHLNVAANRLLGTLPALSGLTRLTYLNFSNNQLSSIPGAHPTASSSTTPLSGVPGAAPATNSSGNLLGGASVAHPTSSSSGATVGGVPLAYPAARVLDVSRNYLGGPWAYLVSQYGGGRVVLRAQGNCFQTSSEEEAAAAAPRWGPDCRRFCRADTLQPPCSGHGTCAFWPRRRNPMCKCDPGTKATLFTCTPLAPRLR